MSENPSSQPPLSPEDHRRQMETAGNWNAIIAEERTLFQSAVAAGEIRPPDAQHRIVLTRLGQALGWYQTTDQATDALKVLAAVGPEGYWAMMHDLENPVVDGPVWWD